MNKQRKFIFFAAAIGILAMFLPWISLSFLGLTSGSINGMHGLGIIIFLCFVATALVAITGDQTKTLGKTMWMISLVAGGLAALIMIIYLLRDLDAYSFLSFGFYLALITSLVLLYYAYTFRAAGYNIKEGFNSLKEDIEKKTKSNNPPPPPPTS